MIVPDYIAEPGIALKDQYFDLKGLSAYSALAVSTLRDYIRKGKLPCFKLEGKILVRRSDFDKWIDQFRTRREQDINGAVDDVFRSLK